MFSLLPDLTCLLIQPSSLLESRLTTLNQAKRRGKCSALPRIFPLKIATKRLSPSYLLNPRDTQCECKPKYLAFSHFCLLGYEPNQFPGGKEEPLLHLWPGSIPKLRQFYLAIEPTWCVGSTDFPQSSPGETSLWLPYARLLTFGHHYESYHHSDKVGSALSSEKKECGIL